MNIKQSHDVWKSTTLQKRVFNEIIKKAKRTHGKAFDEFDGHIPDASVTGFDITSWQLDGIDGKSGCASGLADASLHYLASDGRTGAIVISGPFKCSVHLSGALDNLASDVENLVNQVEIAIEFDEITLCEEDDRAFDDREIDV